MKQTFAELLANILLIVLAGDLLYLYFGGAWYDPNIFIEVAELIALVGIVVLGSYRILVVIKGLGDESAD